MEDFSSLPRLYRDAAVNELWEGPRNVLLSQLHRDLQKVRSWYAPANFVGSILAGADGGLVSDFAAEIEELADQSILAEQNGAAQETCRRWDGFCHRLFHAYQDIAVQEIIGNSLPE